jgi:hypothetical protein
MARVAKGSLPELAIHGFVMAYVHQRCPPMVIDVEVEGGGEKMRPEA